MADEESVKVSFLVQTRCGTENKQYNETLRRGGTQ
ncbi:hypothetical protein CLV65_1265 [Pseudoscardovia suis]|uniref:Uncharacterized protein n=1 Tax=Pseudoscardovia suis TaxID=987063 RepID=A0A261EQH6_9BIFI|nr:hypothetical protein PSSU_1605 [Pseudoscardovia suis]PJJ66013.1 hypothetical protein CLV65_1265 [Pseudoscardovia suis]